MRNHLELPYPILLNSECMKWFKEVPYKVSCFVWKAISGGIPTAAALHHRGVNIPNVVCRSCNLVVEDRDHVLLTFNIARRVWEYVSDWCEVKLGDIDTLEEMLLMVNGWGRCPKKKEGF